MRRARTRPPGRTFRSIVADRLRERRGFEDRWSWLASLYDRVLLGHPSGRLPFRRKLISLRVVGTSKPVLVRMGTSDLRTAREIFLRQEYSEVVARIRDPVRVIVDLGANIGVSVRLWQEAFQEVRIIAVEPDHENLAVCRSNVALSGGQGVVFLEAAAAGRPRDVALDRRFEEWSFRITEPRPDDPSREPDVRTIVRAMTLPDILSYAGVDGDVDLLKCDIEGAEAEVFADCGAWLRRVRRIVVEVHAPYNREKLTNDVRRGGGRFGVTSLKRQPDAEVVLLES
jgi:FkbM family methyltransferase